MKIWRVTEVLALAGLMRSGWYPQDDVARQRGTLVHRLAEAYCHGEQLRALPSLDGYTLGFSAWLWDVKPTILHTEKEVTSRDLRVQGHIDLCALHDGWPTVIDYKTGLKDPAHGVQASAYADLANRDPELSALAGAGRPWCRAILYLPGNGKYEWCGEARLSPRDPAVFRSALLTVQWRHEHRRLKEAA